MSISNNTPKLQSLLEKINALPEASSGVELPALSNAASAGDILSGKEAIDGEGNKITGTMLDNGAISASFDGINTKSYTVPAGYTSGGTVKLDNTIDNEVATQTTQIASNADLIAQIKTALEGKAGGSSGGASVETCTVVIDFSAMVNSAVYNATIFSDNQFNATAGELNRSKSSVTLENVVCGSCIYIIYSGYTLPGYNFNGLERFWLLTNNSFALKVTAAAGEIATITVYDAD